MNNKEIAKVAELHSLAVERLNEIHRLNTRLQECKKAFYEIIEAVEKGDREEAYEVALTATENFKEVSE